MKCEGGKTDDNKRPEEGKMQWEAIWNTKKTREAGNGPAEKFQRCPIINAHKAFLLASQV